MQISCSIKDFDINVMCCVRFGKSGFTITVTADVICMAKNESNAVETAVEFVNKVESNLPIVIVRTEDPDGTLVDFPTCVVAKRLGSLLS